MSVLNRLASALKRNDEEPNIELAQAIAHDPAAIQEVVDGLSNKATAIQHDCIKVLYEIGAIAPASIAPHVDAFLKLLPSKDNRMVWGAMTALGSIAPLAADAIGKQLPQVMRTTEKGSAITQDWGVRVLAQVAAQQPEFEPQVRAFLLPFLENCRPKDFPRHAESVVVLMEGEQRQVWLDLLMKRKGHLTAPQAKRIEKLIRQLQ